MDCILRIWESGTSVAAVLRVPRAVKMAPAPSQVRELLRPISIALAVDVKNPNGTR